jgi:hypothetical protein
MSPVDYVVNGVVLVGFFYAAQLLFATEVQNLIAKDTVA